MASWSTQLLILPKSIKRARGDLLGKLHPPCGSTAIHLRFCFVSVLKYSIFYKNLVSSFYLSIFFVKDALISDNYLFFSGILRNVKKNIRNIKKFDVLCFLETPVLRLTLLPCYRRIAFQLRALHPFSQLGIYYDYYLNLRTRAFILIWCIQSRDIVQLFMEIT